MPVTKDCFKRVSVNTLFMSQDEFELNFLSQDQFELKSMEGKSTRYRRAQPYAPTPADLQALRADTESEEIGSVSQIAPGKNGLTLILEHLPARRVDLIDRWTATRFSEAE